MQIVIDIPEPVIKFINKIGICRAEHVRRLEKAIKNGTPLPKGHGRLIDGDKALRRGGYDESYIRLNTIIEADKEVEDADSD